MNATTFKAQAKQNAKRFLVKTCKINEAELDQYLTQVGEQWGTYVNADGQPVRHADAAFEDAEPSVAPAAAAEETVAAPADPFSNAFGALAMSQLTAPSNTATQVEAPKANREGATPTSGLRIQKDRPERNGVRRQSEGSVGDKLWALYDAAHAAGTVLTLELAKSLAEDAGLNPTSAAIALYNWRKFNGLAGGKK